MRILIVGFFVVFSLSLAPVLPAATALAAQGCSCKGCGCKGGPGWRAPSGYCVSEAKLASLCGSPAGAPCIHEAASQVCFAEPSDTAQEAETEVQ